MDLALPALRWALYADLGVAFGVPMAALVTGIRDAGAVWARGSGVAALLGIALSLAGFVVAVAGMAGVAPAEVDPALALSLLTGTALGWTLIVRCTALLAVASLSLRPTSSHLTPIVVVAAIAVASLAWSGHAAASQGFAGWVRLMGDSAHLLAGLTWFGALVMFADWLWRGSLDEGVLQQTGRALAGFALVGTVLVALLFVSGTVNLLFVLPSAQWPGLIHSSYGQLLLTKLALFAGMLGLAGLNRFTFIPRLERARSPEAKRSAIRHLRLSVSLELLAALGVLGLVAVLGTLDPIGQGH